jgi:heat shock protein HslJ
MTHSHGFSWTLAFVLIALALAVVAPMLSCGSPEQEETSAATESAPTDESPEQLMARGWKLTSMIGAGIDLMLTEDAEITLVFTPDGRVAGSGGCNRYFSAVELGAPGEFALGPVGSTMMACPEMTLALEQQYLRALQGARRYRIAGDRLELLFGEDGVLGFEATTLPES